MLIIMVVPLVNAQITSSGTYGGSLPKIEIAKFTTSEREVNLTISNKTITGKVTLTMDWNAAVSTIKVNLKGEGIDFNVTTVSCRTDNPNMPGIFDETQIFDVYAGQINGKLISGYFGKDYSNKLYGAVMIGDKELTILKKSNMKNYQLSYGDLLISCETKGGMNKQGFPKLTYEMVMGIKNLTGVVNKNGDLKNNRKEFVYELSSPELNDEEMSVWLFLFFSTEIFSGRTDIHR